LLFCFMILLYIYCVFYYLLYFIICCYSFSLSELHDTAPWDYFRLVAFDSPLPPSEAFEARYAQVLSLAPSNPFVVSLSYLYLFIYFILFMLFYLCYLFMLFMYLCYFIYLFICLFICLFIYIILVLLQLFR
jgi:hypothetical protein